MTKEQLIEIVNASLETYNKLDNLAEPVRRLAVNDVAKHIFDKLSDNSQLLKAAYQQGYNDGANAAATDILTNKNR